MPGELADTPPDQIGFAPEDAYSPACQWRAHAERFAPLIDGVEYFRAVREALIGAHRRVMIVGWELHSEVDLVRGEEAERVADDTQGEVWPVRLADLLLALVERRPELRVDLLIWEGSSLFALEREHLPRMKRPWAAHPRICLHWDTDTPKLGSHHQKIVVVDECLAFAGGMDLTKSRWDTHEHRIDEPRRRKPGLIPSYSDPYHDAMAVVDGEAARVLGAWCRERWRRATGETLDPIGDEPTGGAHEDGRSASSADDDPWPRSVEPVLRRWPVRIALTQPEFNGRPELRQVEALFLEQIGRAERLIYVETQYLAHGPIVDALCDRLREADGPEVVLVLPPGCPGTLQSMSMDTRRDALIDRLRDADPGGRLGVYWATLAGGKTEDVFERSVYIHAKVLIVDDAILRIGSANLNSRSMGLDTELDLTVDTREDAPFADGTAVEPARDAIARVRRRLMSYLLDADVGSIERAEREHAGVVGAIEHLRTGERTLWHFEHHAPAMARRFALDLELADPPRPLDDLDAERMLREIAERTSLRGRIRLARGVVIGAVRARPIFTAAGVLALAIVIAFTLAVATGAISREDLGGVFTWLHSSPLGLIGVLIVFVCLASVGFPITVLIAGLGALIASWWSAPVAYGAVLASSLAGFAFGRSVSRETLTRLTGDRLEPLLRIFDRNGVVSVAVVRNLPVAPFAVVNAGFGLTRVSWGAYLAGTAIGMLPGVILLSVFGTELGELVRNPTPGRIATVVLAAGGVIGASLAIQALLRRFGPARAGAPDQTNTEHDRDDTPGDA